MDRLHHEKIFTSPSQLTPTCPAADTPASVRPPQGSTGSLAVTDPWRGPPAAPAPSTAPSASALTRTGRTAGVLDAETSRPIEDGGVVEGTAAGCNCCDWCWCCISCWQCWRCRPSAQLAWARNCLSAARRACLAAAFADLLTKLRGSAVSPAAAIAAAKVSSTEIFPGCLTQPEKLLPRYETCTCRTQRGNTRGQRSMQHCGPRFDG